MKLVPVLGDTKIPAPLQEYINRTEEEGDDVERIEIKSNDLAVVNYSNGESKHLLLRRDCDTVLMLLVNDHGEVFTLKKGPLEECQVQDGKFECPKKDRINEMSGLNFQKCTAFEHSYQCKKSTQLVSLHYSLYRVTNAELKEISEKLQDEPDFEFVPLTVDLVVGHRDPNFAMLYLQLLFKLNIIPRTHKVSVEV